MRYWWVNQNQTFQIEKRGDFMWSPKANANGARNKFYVKAISVVTGVAQTSPKPDFGGAGK